MSTGVVSYPIPLYSNVPIESDFYQPSRFVISNITFGQTTTVTTSVDHNYVISQQVRLIFPPKYGCSQLNEAFGYVISIPEANQVVININSVGTDAFVASPVFLPTQTRTQPQILAIGDISSGPINSSGRIQNITYIPGSFINISPE